MKKRVLQVTGTLDVGGLEIVAKNYFKYINKDSYDFVYLVFDDIETDMEQEIKKLGAKIIHIDDPRKNYFKFYKNLKKIFSEGNKFDVVHSHILFTSGIVMRAAYKSGVPVRVSHSHNSQKAVKNSFIKKLYISIMRKLLIKYSNRHLAVNRDAGNALFGTKVFKDKGIIIENGIDLKNYYFNESIRKEIRSKLGFNDGDIVLGNVARLNKIKNQKFILTLLESLLKEHKNYYAIFVGDGELLTDLKQLAKEYQIENHVKFLGLQKDVMPFLQAMDIFLLPSFHEGAPLSLIEAQASKLYCITSDKVPKTTYLTNYVKGVTIENGPEEWIFEIKNVNPNERVSRDISKLTKSEYNIDKTIQKLEEIYMDK